MSTERFNIILKDYPEYYQVAKARREIFWTRKHQKSIGLALAARIHSGEVIWKAQKNGKEALFDTKATEGLLQVGKFIVKNAKVAGTPRQSKINAQLLWAGGSGSEFVRKAMRNYLHEWFRPAIVRQGPETLFTKEGYYIQLEYIFYYSFADKSKWKSYQDYLNHAFIYMKCFEDVLVELKVIPDDGPKYVRGGYARYVDIMELEGNQDRRLEVKIHFCKNNERIS